MANPNESSTTPNASGDQSAQDTRQVLKEDLSGAVEHVKEQAGAQIDQYKDTAADQLENIAQTAQSAAQQMEAHDTLGLSGYVANVAGQMTSLADGLRNRNAEQLLQDAGRLARENPMLFLAGSVALGLGLSRLFKASAPSTSSWTSPDAQDFSDSGFANDASDAPYDPISPSTLAAEEMVATHPHNDDVLHSARPGTGIPDRPSGLDRAADFDDEPPRAGSPLTGMPRGDV
jgi:hypothetical protein